MKNFPIPENIFGGGMWWKRRRAASKIEITAPKSIDQENAQ